MQKQVWTWTPEHLPQPARMARWGYFGAPVLIFPTAGGDFEEIERFQLVASLAALIDGGRIKVYSLDAVATRSWLARTTSLDACLGLQERFDSFLYEDVLRRIRSDCQDDHIEPILAGASLGAAAAIHTLCAHPNSFRAAIGLSGLFYGAGAGLSNLDGGSEPPRQEVIGVSNLSTAQIEQLRTRAILLGSGAGAYECPADSKRLVDEFGSKGIVCRFNLWGAERDHTWSTWRDMLPGLLSKVL